MREERSSGRGPETSGFPVLEMLKPMPACWWAGSDVAREKSGSKSRSQGDFVVE